MRDSIIPASLKPAGTGAEVQRAPIGEYWLPMYQSGSFVGTITYNGAQVSFAEPMTSEGKSGGPLGKLAAATSALPGTLKAALDTGVRTAAAAIPDYPGTLEGSSFSGPLNANIEGLSGPLTGLNRLSFSCPDYLAVVKVTGRNGGTPFTCMVTLHATRISAAVVYDPCSGRINQDPSNTTFELHPAHSVDCSTGLDFLPIIGNLINNLEPLPTHDMDCSTGLDLLPIIGGLITDWAHRKIDVLLTDRLKSFSAAALAAVTPYGRRNLGICSAVPTGVHIIDGVDIGLHIKHHFSALLRGKTLSFSIPKIARPLVGAGEWPVGWLRKRRPNPVADEIFSIDFSDATTQLRFALEDRRSFAWMHMVCPPPPFPYQVIP